MLTSVNVKFGQRGFAMRNSWLSRFFGKAKDTSTDLPAGTQRSDSDQHGSPLTTQPMVARRDFGAGGHDRFGRGGRPFGDHGIYGD